MSLSYLKSILPIPEVAKRPLANEPAPFKDISEHELGVLLSQFEQFLDNLQPFKTKLQPIEQFLLHFDAEIEHLSESLRSLQFQSNELSTGLDRHRNLVEKLNPVILDLVVPPSISESVLRDPIDEKWFENIQFITEKQQLIRKIALGSSLLDYKDSKVFAELQNKIKILEAKVMERIRNHMIEQIRVMRRSVHASSQAVQAHLLQIKDTYAFLKSRHLQLAQQLQIAYVYTMKWYYTTRFAKYLHSLQKLRLKHIDQYYILGSTGDLHDTGKTGFLGVIGASYGTAQSTTSTSSSNNHVIESRVTLPEYFLSVTKRIAILSAEDEEAQRAIPSQIAETTPFSYWLEFAFNQFSNTVLDNVIVEYLFAIDFFYQGSEKFDLLHMVDLHANPADKDTDWPHIMFADVFCMGLSYANWLVSSLSSTLGSRLAGGSGISTYASAYNHASGSAGNAGTCDAYAVLLMIRIVQKQNATLHNQFHVPVMEDYHNALLLSLWPHFTRIIDLNCDSLKKNILGRNSSYIHSSHLSADANHAPIHTTQQFAQLLLGLFKLAFADTDADLNADTNTVISANANQLFLREPISMSVNRLRNDYEGALTKASSHVFGLGKGKTSHKEMFLFNNYFLLVTILSNEFDASKNPFIQEQISHFQLLCDAYRPK